MKNFTLLFLLLCLGWQYSYAQSETSALKFGVSGLFDRELQFEYERALKGGTSFQVELLAGIPRKIPFVYTSPFSSVGSGDQYNMDFDTSSMYTFAVIPEFRLYPLRRTALRGFHVGPFLKAKVRLMNARDTYKNYQMYPTATSNTTVFTIGGGIGVGYQLILGKFTIDIGAGIGMDYHMISTKFTSSDPGENYENWQTHIDAALSNVPVFGDDLTTTAEGSSVSAKGNTPFIGVRPVISLGYAFK